LEIFYVTRKSRIKNAIKKLFIDIFPALLAVGIIAIFRIDPNFTEKVFSQGVFPIVSWIIGILGRIVPFSLIAVFAIILPVVCMGFIVHLFVSVFKGKSDMPIKYLRWILRTASIIFLVFALTCAPNYTRITFADQCGLKVRDATVYELTELCADLLVRTADARNEVEEDENGVFTLGVDFSKAADKALTHMRELKEEYPFLLEVYDKPKKMILSEALSYMQVTGFYNCFTNETNINVHMPDLEIPFTMCHEMAHTSGFMREDEANFIGYLATSRSDDPAARYSGLICALNLSMNQLYRTAPDIYWQLRSYYPENIERDLSHSGSYWAKYEETKTAEVYDTINDAYLKANDQFDGTQSYGRMVDLLLAEYRYNNGID